MIYQYFMGKISQDTITCMVQKTEKGLKSLIVKFDDIIKEILYFYTFNPT